METVHICKGFSLSMSEISKCVFNLSSCYKLNKPSTSTQHDSLSILVKSGLNLARETSFIRLLLWYFGMGQLTTTNEELHSFKQITENKREETLNISLMRPNSTRTQTLTHLVLNLWAQTTDLRSVCCFVSGWTLLIRTGWSDLGSVFLLK